MRTPARRAAGCLLAAVGLAALGSGCSTGHAPKGSPTVAPTSGSTGAASLATKVHADDHDEVATPPKGFHAVSGGAAHGVVAGVVGAKGRLPDSCGFLPATPPGLVAASVAAFAGTTAPGAFAVVCTAAMSSGTAASAVVAAAVRGRETSGAPTTFPFLTFAVPGVPGASGVGLPGNETVSFATGPFAVTAFVSNPGSSAADDARTKGLAVALAVAQDRRLGR